MNNIRIIRPAFQSSVLLQHPDPLEVSKCNLTEIEILVFGYDSNNELVGAIGINFDSGCYTITVNNTYISEHFSALVSYFQNTYSCDISTETKYELLVNDYISMGFDVMGKTDDSVKMLRTYARFCVIAKYDVKISVSEGNISHEVYEYFGKKCKKVGYITYNVEGVNLFYVSNLRVSSKYRGTGIGRFLVQNIINIAKYYKYDIELYSVNDSEGFYAKLGFVATSERNWIGNVDMKYFTE